MEYYLRNSSVTKSQVLSKHLEAGNVCVIRVYICFCFITSFKQGNDSLYNHYTKSAILFFKDAIYHFQKALKHEEEKAIIKYYETKSNELKASILSIQNNEKNINDSIDSVPQQFINCRNRANELMKGGNYNQASILFGNCVSAVLDVITHLHPHSELYRKYEELLEDCLKGTTDFKSKSLSILMSSSIINNLKFPPFNDKTPSLIKSHNNSSTSSDLEIYSDPDNPPLSPEQIKRGGNYRRPCQISDEQWYIKNKSDELSIVQDCTSDCSLVSSLCICVSYERKFKKLLITNIIYPQDREGNPLYNRTGKYTIKLYYNGCARCIVIDDTIPVDKEGSFLCSYTKELNELWVPLIEKAYMKVYIYIYII